MMLGTNKRYVLPKLPGLVRVGFGTSSIHSKSLFNIDSYVFWILGFPNAIRYRIVIEIRIVVCLSVVSPPFRELFPKTLRGDYDFSIFSFYGAILPYTT